MQSPQSNPIAVSESVAKAAFARLSLQDQTFVASHATRLEATGLSNDTALAVLAAIGKYCVDNKIEIP